MAQDNCAKKKRQAALKEVSVDDCHFSSRIRNCLRWQNAKTLADLDAMSDGEILRLPNLGMGSLIEIRTKIQLFLKSDLTIGYPFEIYHWVKENQTLIQQLMAGELIISQPKNKVRSCRQSAA